MPGELHQRERRRGGHRDGFSAEDQIDADSSDTVNGGEGSDLITGGSVINAGGGDDTMFESGDGPVSGGSGDDRFVQTLPINGIDGGDGLDSWEVDFDQVQVSLGRSTPP